ncbi:hypothetical protein JCM10213v2_005992 [Rhodosporidiobolus nylandii]
MDNLCTALRSRLEVSGEYLFGSLNVYGENNNSCIAGVYMIRGNDIASIMDVAPTDFKADREFIEGQRLYKVKRNSQRIHPA